MTVPFVAESLASNAQADEQVLAARRRLRIASVCTLFPTDAEEHKGIFVARRVSQLAKVADVQAIQPLPWFPVLRPQRESISATSNDTLNIVRRRMFYVPGVMKHLDGRWLARSILPVLKQLRDESGLDLVDAHFGYPEGVGAVLAAERLGIPVFVTLRGNEQVYLKQPAIRSQLVEALHACRGIIAVSHGLRNVVVEAGINANKIRVISNAVDRGQFCPGDKRAARIELDLPKHSPVIVSVGQLVSGKGHDVLIRAVEELRRRHPDVVLAIIGAASYERDVPAKLRTLIESLQMADTVLLVGPQSPERVAQWLRAADIFALCTRREGCCNAVLEALACGVPVVTTDAGDNRRFVDPPANGYIAPFDDPAAICSTLEVALDRKWNRAQISNSLPPDGWEGVARAVLEFFHSRLQSNDESRGGKAHG